MKGANDPWGDLGKRILSYLKYYRKLPGRSVVIAYENDQTIVIASCGVLDVSRSCIFLTCEGTELGEVPKVVDYIDHVGCPVCDTYDFVLQVSQWMLLARYAPGLFHQSFLEVRATLTRLNSSSMCGVYHVSCGNPRLHEECYMCLVEFCKLAYVFWGLRDDLIADVLCHIRRAAILTMDIWEVKGIRARLHEQLAA